jgi:hypothetical protein
MELEYPRQILEKSKIKFHQNPSSGSRVVPCGQTDMTKLIVAFRNCANTPKDHKHKAFMYSIYVKMMVRGRSCATFKSNYLILPNKVKMNKDKRNEDMYV